MKNYIYILSFTFICFSSCDKIEKPIPELPGGLDWNLYPGDSLDYLALYNFNSPDSNWEINSNTKRNILLEYYTGHKCPNCPGAAKIGKEIEANNDNVFMVSIHAIEGNVFQYTLPPILDANGDGIFEFTTDFTTDAGNTYAEDIPGLDLLPNGTINRMTNSNDPNEEIWFEASEWVTAINQLDNNDLIANIQVQTNYFPSTNGLFIHTESEIKTNLTGDYRLIIYLLRESVIASQDSINTVAYYYNHHNVLSDNINGAWGTPIGANNILEETKFYNDFSFRLPTDSTYNIENLSLVTYLCNRNTFEIIQVTKTDLEP